MFGGCTSLVGGSGTTYNSSYIDKTYAHIDGGTSSPGYLTLISVNSVVPEGATYYVGVTSNNVGDYNGYTAKYIAGQTMPSVVNNGDVFVYGDYEYRYDKWYSVDNSGWVPVSEENNGWGVRVLDNTKSSYSEII